MSAESGSEVPPDCPKIALVIQGLLWFHRGFRVVCPSAERCHHNFDRDYIESVNYLGRMDILTTLTPPIHEHGLSFHLFVPSLICFIKILLYSGLLYLWLSLFTGIFILCDAIVNT